MNYRWLMAKPRPRLTTELVAALNISSLLARCLANRGLTAPDEGAVFLQPRLKQLSDPENLPNLTQAVDRLWQARESGEEVLVFGDYDVDGVTATALLLVVLKALGWQLRYYLPHRLDDGYGLTRDVVESCLAEHSPGVLLAVDCGSTATDTIGWLADTGIDVVVLDHHQVASPPPRAVALVNPQLSPAGRGSCRELCSVGLAFKLAHAVVKRGRRHGLPAARDFDLRQLLDLVALGTIADLVPVTGENRILVTSGLQRLNDLTRPGLKALRDVAGIEGRIEPHEVGFQLAPRLNAAGRLENATEALDLLLAVDEAVAKTIAASLDARNHERQNIERGIAEEVIEVVRARFRPDRDYVIVEGQLLWHVGVVGIVASRVLHEFYRPTLILGGDGYEWRGSGRSIEGFDLAAALRECDELLVRHGGHAMAAGMTVHPENVPNLRAKLNAIAKDRLSREQLLPPLRLDAAVSPRELTLDRLIELRSLEPLGQGNPSVQLVVHDVRLRRQPVRLGRDRKHLKFWVTDGDGSLEAIWWGGADKPWPQGSFDLACTPRINEFNGRTTVQLKVLDWRPVR